MIREWPASYGATLHVFHRAGGTRRPAARAILRAAALGMGLALTLTPGRGAWAQTNFEPLERGDFREEEDRVLVIKWIEPHLQYAIRLHDLDAGDADGRRETTRIDQDLRLSLQTDVHRDIGVHLVLEVFQEPLSDGNIREQPGTDRKRTADTGTLAVNAREAYLQYNFNPNSEIKLGRHELSVADREGLLFRGNVPGVTFDCRIGTWCMPFGAFKVNEGTSDWLYHWGLDYTAWDEPNEGSLPSKLKVGVYRIYYSEQNVPLARNNGPGYFNPEDPTTPILGQMTDDAGNPVYYDIEDHKIFGLNVDWEGGILFGNLNWVDSQGRRVFHLYRGPDGMQDMQFDSLDPDNKIQKRIHGWVLQTELGLRWRPAQQGLIGLRMLYARGDNDRNGENDGGAFIRGLNGYYELTPGSYGGNRLWFNGSDSSVDGGGGLGHSVNNTRMYGIFLEAHDPEGAHIGYSAGFYYLRRILPVVDVKGQRQDYIGIELDNMLTWYFHKSAKAQFEVNLLEQGGAFSYDDFTPPDASNHLVVQTIARIVYEF